jgi:aspartate kinase
MSSYKKSEGTTSRLLEAAGEILKPDSNRYLDIVDMIERDHIECIKGAVCSDSLSLEAIADVKLECNRLKSFMSAAEVTRNNVNNV